MSAVETPPPEQPTGRRCPRCGASMTDEQEWCLNCGAAVGAHVVAARGWRTPIVLAGTLVVLAAIAIAVAIVQLADDTDTVASTPPAAIEATPTPVPQDTPSATPDPALTPDPTIPEASGETTPTPSPTPSATPDSSSSTTEWPAGKEGYTIILSSDSSKADAERKADGFEADGIADVGILDSDDFSTLNPGFWVVFSGVYDSQSEASAALDGIDAKDAYIRRIVPD